MSLRDTTRSHREALAARLEPELAKLFARLLEGPAPLLRALAKRGPHPEGLELDLQTAVVVRLAELVMRRPLHELPVDEARRAYLQSGKLIEAEPPSSVRTRELAVPVQGATLAARLYEPEGLSELSPGILYLHGGGFVIGDLDSHHTTCAELARAARARLVAVDYRLAPEHRFPVAADDTYAAYVWLLEHAASLGIDAGRIAVAGDSAGGNLAAVLCLDARDRGLRSPALQVLIYPATDMTRSAESHRSFADGYLLTAPLMDWFLAQYLPPGQDLRDPRCSPLHAASLEGLPPAIVSTAGFDPLRDEGQAYADRLERAGVPVVRRHHVGLVHGFATMTGPIAAARIAMRELAELVRERLA